MKILVLNRGSSSVKCSLYDFTSLPDEAIKPEWEDQIKWSVDELKRLFSGKKIDCIGHRIVHGGSKYQSSVLIDAEVKREIARLADLAPLHNLADWEGIEALEKLFPNVPQVAVFDTSFHRTLPLETAIYPGPYEWFEKGIRRYGFHGTSFQYCTKKVEALLGHMPSKMVICHLGSGASLCAVQDGSSIDTTMGFTPLEGLMMDTRSGTIDPGLLLYLCKQGSADDLSHLLYEKSGLLGLSGISSDMRDVLEKASEGNERAQLAIDVYVHRLISMIGSMIASLGGLDVLVFTGGIGENSSVIRKRVYKRFSFLGLSKDKVLVIHTQEDFEIARECWCKIRHSG